MIPHGHHYSGLPRDGLWATVTGNFGPFLRESRSSGTRLSAKHTLQREPTPGKELRCSSSIFVLSAWLALLSPWWVSPSQAPNAKLHPCAVHPNPGWAPAWAQAKGESCWHKWWSRKKTLKGFQSSCGLQMISKANRCRWWFSCRWYVQLSVSEIKPNFIPFWSGYVFSQLRHPG